MSGPPHGCAMHEAPVRIRVICLPMHETIRVDRFIEPAMEHVRARYRESFPPDGARSCDACLR